MVVSRPFVQGRYEALPQVPRLPHGYAATQAHELIMDSRAFGPMRVHYRELGDGPALLLIHGLMTSSYSWRYVAERLARRHRVIMPDLPGAGLSDKPAERSFHPDALADWIGEFQRALGISGCLTVGNSLGGYLCMRLALREPEAMSRLVNIHSPALPLPRFRALRLGLSVPGVPGLLARYIRRDPYRWVHRFVHYYDESLKSQEEAAAYGTPLASPAGAACLVRFLQDTCDPRVFQAFVGQLHDRRTQGKPFPVPLQLVYSRQDPMVPPAVGAALMALVPEAEGHWLAETSHFAHVDSPDRLLDVIEPFLVK
jgi:pimeloyl-ACP methyl ester carboxylesterase